MILLQSLFWLSTCGLLYIYAGYPLLVWIAGRVRQQSHATDVWSGRVSIVIACHNEAHRLRAKLDSLFASVDANRIAEVLIGSDGSMDGTAALVEACGHERVRLRHFELRRGKPAVLNDLVPLCTSEIIVLTDARQPVEPTALSLLTAPFANPRIGVVSGALKFHTSADDSAAAEGVSVYWAYETFIRTCESRFRSAPGATGALYAIRRELFRPVPADTLLDDVVIPMQAVEQGYRCVLEPGAIAWDTPSQSTREESVRKRRTIAGCAQLVVNQPRWLLPWCNPIWWEFVSHKLARLLSPILMALVLVTNLMLASDSFYMDLLVVQAAFYGSAAVGGRLRRAGSFR